MPRPGDTFTKFGTDETDEYMDRADAERLSNEINELVDRSDSVNRRTFARPQQVAHDTYVIVYDFILAADGLHSALALIGTLRGCA